MISAIPNAVSFTMAGAGHKIGPVDVVDGTVMVTAEQTTNAPAGVYDSEWKVVDGVETSLPSGPRITIADSLAHGDRRTVEKTQNQRILEAALKTLETASASSDLTVNSGVYSFSFESRRELYAYVQRLRVAVAREQGKPPASRKLRL